MFKRSLTAVAVFGVMAGAAAAADVQMYGKLDTGIAYTRVTQAGQDAVTSFGMGSGLVSGSRFGVKGTEDLGNGMTVGFKLEGNLDSTNGDTKLFKREATLNVGGAFGKVYFGRMGVLSSSAGPVGIGNIDPLGAGTVIGGFDNVRANPVAGRLDNTVAYVSPEFGGAQIYAQYGMGEGDQNKKTAKNRYVGIGATFEQGPLSIVAVADAFLGQEVTAPTANRKNQYALTLGASYDFDVIKPTFQLAAFKNANNFAGAELTNELANGVGAQIAAEIPAGPGVVIASLGYGHASVKTNQVGVASTKVAKADNWNLGAAYVYPMSKRTSLYAGAGYLDQKTKDIATSVKTKVHTYQAAVGMIHSF